MVGYCSPLSPFTNLCNIRDLPAFGSPVSTILKSMSYSLLASCAYRLNSLLSDYGANIMTEDCLDTSGLSYLPKT